MKLIFVFVLFLLFSFLMVLNFTIDNMHGPYFRFEKSLFVGNLNGKQMWAYFCVVKQTWDEYVKEISNPYLVEEVMEAAPWLALI